MLFYCYLEFNLLQVLKNVIYFAKYFFKHNLYKINNKSCLVIYDFFVLIKHTIMRN